MGPGGQTWSKRVILGIRIRLGGMRIRSYSRKTDDSSLAVGLEPGPTHSVLIDFAKKKKKRTGPYTSYTTKPYTSKLQKWTRTLIFENSEVSKTAKRPTRQVEWGSRLTRPDYFFDGPPGRQTW